MAIVQKIKNVFIFFKLSKLINYIVFIGQYIKYFKKNLIFKNSNPTVKLPPLYSMYETYRLDYKEFYNEGFLSAQKIYELYIKYQPLKKACLHILDWGCGPGRVITHLKNFFTASANIYGTDSNLKYINWCSENILSASFKFNSINPPTAYPDNTFDLIYGLSIITHLSEKNHYGWLKELNRILKPDALLIITSQGDCFLNKLLVNEKKSYLEGNLIVRDVYKEGNRLFTAFQPQLYMKKLFNDCNYKIIKFIPGNNPENPHGLQDTWVLQPMV